MTRVGAPVLGLVLAAVLVGGAWAQEAAEPAPAPATAGPTMPALLAQMEKGPGGPSSLEAFKLTSDCQGFADATTRERCWIAYRAYFDYYESGFAHRKAVFWWQHVSSVVIFGVVLGLVGVGIFFAWVQFRRDLVAPQPATGPEQAPVVHQVELGQSGLRVSSPVLGVIILVISLAFFYLYLVYVYPIGEVF
jgi:hypothetical protein